MSGGDDRRCTATAKRTRKRCQKRGESVCPGCGVCRSHGCNCGSPRGAPRGNKNALKHGIYAVGLREDERDIWHEIPLGNLDDEIRLARIQLRRAFEAQARTDGTSVADVVGALELSSMAKKSGFTAKGPVDETSITHTRRDYWSEIYRLLGRVGDLETKRAAISGGAPADPMDTAERIRAAVLGIDQLTDAGD